MSSKKYGIFSFFAGAGFLDLGFDHTNGFETLFVNDYHKPFMDVYIGSRLGLGISEPIYGYCGQDITSFLTSLNTYFLKDYINEAKKNYDLIGFIGGPPCPDFSVAGKNKGASGVNGKLSETYIELIVRNKPDFFLFENVKGLYRTKKHRDFFESIKLKLIKNGYYLTERLINSIEYGVPQDRERIILIGFKGDKLTDYGMDLNGDHLLKSFNWNNNLKYTSKDVFSYPWPKQETFIENAKKPLPHGIDKELTVEYWFDKNDVQNHPNSTHHFKPRAGLSKFQTIQEGDDLKKSYKRLHRWRYSPTAAYGNNEVHLHPYKARRISAAEALAIQSLPREFIIPDHVTLTNMFKTIGNGVPYLAAKGLASTILDYIEQVKSKQLQYAEIVSQ